MKNQKLTFEIVKHIFKLNGLTEKENEILKIYQIQDLIIEECSFPMFSCFVVLDDKIIKIIVLDLSCENKEYSFFFNISESNSSEWFGMDLYFGGDFALFKRYDKFWQDVEMKTQAQMIIGFEDLCNFPVEWKKNESISEEELKMIKEFVE